MCLGLAWVPYCSWVTVHPRFKAGWESADSKRYTPTGYQARVCPIQRLENWSKRLQQACKRAMPSLAGYLASKVSLTIRKLFTGKPIATENVTKPKTEFIATPIRAMTRPKRNSRRRKGTPTGYQHRQRAGVQTKVSQLSWAFRRDWVMSRDKSLNIGRTKANAELRNTIRMQEQEEQNQLCQRNKTKDPRIKQFSKVTDEKHAHCQRAELDANTDWKDTAEQQKLNEDNPTSRNRVSALMFEGIRQVKRWK